MGSRLSYLLFLNEILISPEWIIPPTFLLNHFFFVAIIHWTPNSSTTPKPSRSSLPGIPVLHLVTVWICFKLLFFNLEGYLSQSEFWRSQPAFSPHPHPPQNLDLSAWRLEVLLWSNHLAFPLSGNQSSSLILSPWDSLGLFSPCPVPVKEPQKSFRGKHQWVFLHFDILGR